MGYVRTSNTVCRKWQKFLQQLWGNAAGFTLAEIVIATGVFVIISGIVLSIYFPVIKIQKRSIEYSRLQQEVQIIFEIMAKDVRGKNIFYGYQQYADTGGPDPAGEAHLALRVNGATAGNYDYAVYCLSNSKVYVLRRQDSSTAPADCSSTDPLEFAPITASDVVITELQFFIKPQTNPFQQGAPDVRQPRVTVVLTAQKDMGAGSSPVTIHTQTTIPQRFTEKK